MSTLGVMRSRIELELRRNNIRTQIDNAIETAINAYQTEPWSFQESRTVTFETVSGTEFYTDNLSDLVRIDYVMLTVGDSLFRLLPLEPQEIEHLSDSATNQGEPTCYCWYGDQLRLYPTPNDAWTVRLGGIFKVGAPEDDDEADNRWMTTAEHLIRSRAKLELAIHVLMDPGLAEAMGAATQEAYERLRGASNRKIGSGYVKPFCL